MNYTMRSLKTKDLFLMSKILKKMNLKMEVKKEVSQEQFGADLIMKFLENISLAQNEINEFLAQLVGITAQQFDDLEIGDTLAIINQFKNMNGVSDFLQLASK